MAKRHKMRFANESAAYEKGRRAERERDRSRAARDAERADDKADPLCHCGAITALEVCPYCDGSVLRGDA